MSTWKRHGSCHDHVSQRLRVPWLCGPPARGSRGGRATGACGPRRSPVAGRSRAGRLERNRNLDGARTPRTGVRRHARGSRPRPCTLRLVEQLGGPQHHESAVPAVPGPPGRRPLDAGRAPSGDGASGSGWVAGRPGPRLAEPPAASDGDRTFTANRAAGAGALVRKRPAFASPRGGAEPRGAPAAHVRAAVWGVTATP